MIGAEKLKKERTWPQKRNGKICFSCGSFIEWSFVGSEEPSRKAKEICPKCGERQ